MKGKITALLAMLLTTSSAFAQHIFREMEYTPEQTTFTLNAPSTATPVVKIFAKYDDEKAEKTVKMTRIGTDRWGATVKKNLLGKFYAFNIYGAKGDISRDTPGVFARAVSVNGKRGAIIDADKIGAETFKNDRSNLPKLQSAADLIIYEMHHRDFSIHPSSGVPAEHRGKFLALTHAKQIAHLKALGVNAVHILPSFDYASVDETVCNTKAQYNWGYDPLNYNVPEGSYSTDPFTPETRIREFQTMVQALHNAGIRVILDVVYNHTFDKENSNFDKTYPDYYYRHKADGAVSDGSGCGNETASERPLMRQFMIESMRYWHDFYHIDGFRIDLMGIHDIETVNAVKAALPPDVFIYGEGWSAGECAYPAEKLAMKANTRQMKGVAAFSDEMRDALRGPFSDDTKGAFLAGIGGEEESLKFGIVGAIIHPQVDMKAVNYAKEAWADEPTQMISYVSCHDDMCLVDRLKASIPGISQEEVIRLDLLAQTFVLTSQGVPFLLSGEEMLRNKRGVHNSYNSPDEINRLDWTNLERYPQVFAYYSRLVNLRKNHPALRMGRAELVRKHLNFLPVADPCLVAFHLNGKAVGDEWSDIIVVLNSNKEAKEVAIPEGNYTIVCCDGTINEAGLGTLKGNTALVEAQSALILKR